MVNTLKRSPLPCGGAGGANDHRYGMSAFQYEQEEEEMPERVGIVTGGASGTPPDQVGHENNGEKVLDWRWRQISHKRDGNSLL